MTGQNLLKLECKRMEAKENSVWAFLHLNSLTMKHRIKKITNLLNTRVDLKHQNQELK